MSLLNKVKDFFYDEEEVDEYEETMPIKVHHKEKKEKIKVNKLEHEKREEKAKVQDVSEIELFKAERTFNFPMDIYEDENDSIKEEKEEKTNISIEKKETVNTNNYTTKQENPYSNIRNYAKYEDKKEEKEVKKFKPTPVISPIYGILDKNYKKEDIIIDSAAEKDRTKKLDYDEVRKKAYKDVYKEDEEEKSIFFNLNDKQEEKEENDYVKIVYNDVTYEEEKDDKNVTIGEKIEEYQKELEKDIDLNEEDNIDDDTKILSETKEQDLFNLIDNMYNSEVDDEGDEE